MGVFSGAGDAPAVPFRTGLPDFDFVGGSGARLAISQDGTQIAVASFVDGVSKIFVRASNQREFREIDGTDGANHPGFSPDGGWLVFDQGDVIWRVQLSGGPILRVTEGVYPHWGLDETIVFEREGVGIFQVSPSGADLVPILEGGTAANARPRLLPDGRAVVFEGTGERGSSLMVVEIESGTVTDLEVSGFNPRYIPTGHVVYGHESQALMAVPFDLATYRVTGAPATALPDVLVYSGGATQFAVSETGTAVYGLSGASAGGRELVIFDLAGVPTVIPLGEDTYRVPRFSPDGGRIAYDLDNRIWVYDRDSGANTPITTGGDTDYPAAWSRDGRYVYFESTRDGTLGSDGFRKLADGSADAEQLFRRAGIQFPLSTSLDGTQLLVEDFTADRGIDLVIMSEGPDSAIFTDYLRGDWNETMGTISPDGERVAYVSDQSGVAEVYVRSFPEAEGRVNVSEGGGTEPVWAPDGTAIYYLNGGRVMRAPVTTGGFGEPQMLFEGSWAIASTALPMTNWDVHPDGRSFVFVRNPVAEDGDVGSGPPIIRLEVVVNWFEELNERLGN